MQREYFFRPISKGDYRGLGVGSLLGILLGFPIVALEILLVYQSARILLAIAYQIGLIKNKWQTRDVWIIYSFYYLVKAIVLVILYF